jgi:hypothetical protein
VPVDEYHKCGELKLADMSGWVIATCFGGSVVIMGLKNSGMDEIGCGASGRNKSRVGLRDFYRNEMAVANITILTHFSGRLLASYVY